MPATPKAPPVGAVSSNACSPGCYSIVLSTAFFPQATSGTRISPYSKAGQKAKGYICTAFLLLYLAFRDRGKGMGGSSMLSPHLQSPVAVSVELQIELHFTQASPQSSTTRLSADSPAFLLRSYFCTNLVGSKAS